MPLPDRNQPTLILGIDPGSIKTGFGIIEATGSRHRHVASGVLHLPTQQTLAERLKVLFDKLSAVIDQHAPQQLAVEQVFIAKSAASALKLGQARGAIIVACAQQGLALNEYSARQVKQAVVGTGAATKEQVQYMVKMLLGLSTPPQEDEADALAVALCHTNNQVVATKFPEAARRRRGRWY